MKKFAIIVSCILSISACGDNTSQDPNAPTPKEKDIVTLAFLNKVPKQSGSAVECKTQLVGEYYYTGCAFTSVGSRGNTYIFLYNKDKDSTKRFYALNGSAMTIYDQYFKNEPLLGNYKDTFGLPIPKDIDLGVIHKAFESK